jgi:hypothetical protein
VQKLYSSKNPPQPWPPPLSSSSTVAASPRSTAHKRSPSNDSIWRHKIPLWGLIKKDAKKETSERKEGEEAPVESQGKKEKKNLQFHSKRKIRSNSLFVAIAATA